MRRKEYVAPGRLAEWAARPDAALYLTKPGRGIFDDTELIRFSSREALEAFNVRAKLRPLVYTEVPRGMAIHAHQREAARAAGEAK